MEGAFAMNSISRNLKFERQMSLPVPIQRAVSLDCGYRIDLVVEDSLILELKCLEHILPVYEAQLLTYLKLTGQAELA